MQPIKQTVKQLVKKHGTNDPVEIANQKNILLLYEDFKSILGYFNASRRIAMIHVNRNISDVLQRFVIAHELGHLLLHPKVNVPFLRSNTLCSIDRIEREANEFAAELLIPDELLLEGYTVSQAAAASGVPPEIAHLKSLPEPRKKQNIWTREDSFLTIKE